MKAPFRPHICYNGLMRKHLSAFAAALLTFTSGGEVYWNVLGMTDSSLEVKKIADNLAAGPSTSVLLTNDNGQVFLSYDGSKNVNVSGYKEDIIEVEEKSAGTISIKVADSGFSIKQRDVTVNTSFPIKVNSRENKLSVETATGEKFLAVLPYEAVTQIIRTNIVSSVVSGSLIEKEEGEVVYAVDGEKQITLFNIFSFAIPIKVEISATTGTVMNVDQPLWYSVVDFLLV